jgi:hypothetical protein
VVVIHLGGGACTAQCTETTLRFNHLVDVCSPDPIPVSEVVVTPATVQPALDFTATLVVAGLAVGTSPVTATVMALELA